jgi:hypothetical protein
MKKYLQALYKSFGSIRFYYQAIHHWVGSGILYLLLLATLISILLCVRVSVGLYQFNLDQLPHILSQWPTVTLENGEIKTEKEQVYTVKAKTGETVLIVDTKSSVSDLRQKKSALIVGKDFIMTQNGDNGYKVNDLKDYKDKKIVFTRSYVEKFFNNLPYLFFVFLPVIIFGQWIILIAMAIAAAVLSYVVTAYMKDEFDFETRMRMGAIAITPPLLLNQLIESISTYSISFWMVILFWALYIYAIVVGARAYKLKMAPVVP